MYNFPFLMGQGVWLDSEKLAWNDEVREVLKHGTLSIGFIGLAETLGGADGRAPRRERGRRRTWAWRSSATCAATLDAACQRSAGMNYTLLATPAEGLSGRFVRIDRERYGVHPGRHRPGLLHQQLPCAGVLRHHAPSTRSSIEAPYHALTNAGHITYVELDGDPPQNLEAFEKIVRCMKDSGIGYGSINHPVDRDPVCGYNGIIGDDVPQLRPHRGGAACPSSASAASPATWWAPSTASTTPSAPRKHDRVKHFIASADQPSQ